MNKKNKFICLIFLALVVSDICSYIKYALNYNFRIETFYGIFSKMGTGRIVNLSIIYFFMVCIIYFIFNFFKKTDVRG